MTMKSMQLLSYRSKTRDFSCSPVIRTFCDSLFSDTKFTISAKVKNGVAFFGKSELSSEKDTQGANVFTKCIYKKQTYHSVDYDRVTRYNDTIIQLECGSIAQILEILDMPNDEDCLLRVSKFEAKPMLVEDIKIPHIWEITSIIDKIVVSLKEVCSKITFLQFEDKNYACKPPNIIECS